MNLTKKDKEQIKQWVAALRSGKYKQTKHKLQDNNGYCCLGVACDLFCSSPETDDQNFLYGNFPESQPTAPEWLHRINSEYYKSNAGKTLSRLNDVLEYSFEEIANEIEKEFLK